MKYGYCPKCGYPQHLCKCHLYHEPGMNWGEMSGYPEMKCKKEMCPPPIQCHIPECKPEKECVKTLKYVFKLYKTCKFHMCMICPVCGHEFDYNRHHGVCPKCMMHTDDPPDDM
ncbi:Hypothetical protein LUCI_1810 [Lucifera butyrica]|uniref:Uncharacterized protein n=1 Tax=Lucifera butyrica TaxID=1351585 RepID=A0A498R541_9FIRM|nr:Hypothetical protein LUCI_1810 [Lucifera butyrica]